MASCINGKFLSWSVTAADEVCEHDFQQAALSSGFGPPMATTGSILPIAGGPAAGEVRVARRAATRGVGRYQTRSSGTWNCA